MIDQNFAVQATDLIQSKGGIITGTAGAMAAVAPTESMNQVMGDFLSSHGFWILTYTEWMKVIGTIWVLCLIADFLLRQIRRLLSGNFLKDK